MIGYAQSFHTCYYSGLYTHLLFQTATTPVPLLNAECSHITEPATQLLRLTVEMKDTKLHIVGLEALDEQCSQLSIQDPTNPDYVNKAWFFMYCYKVLLCPKRYSHDWGACPYAHNNESARRRDPQRFSYSSCICPNTGKGECLNGPQCRYAHTLFEYWLHPARFRTQMCKSGAGCKRALCFFAHSQNELRQPDKCDSLAQSSAIQLASAAAAITAGPMQAGFGPACRADAAGLALDGSGVLPPLAAAGAPAGLDSTSSNVSCATVQQGSSPTALDDFSGEFAPIGMRSLAVGSSGNLQLSTAPRGLLSAPQMPNCSLPAVMLGGSQYSPSVSAAAVSSAGLVTSVPQQLHDLLQQQQHHQQQQQLVAGMAAMTLSRSEQQLQPSNAVLGNANSMSAPLAPLPVTTTAAVAAPIYASIMQGVTACAAAPGYASMMQPGMMQPGVMVANGMGQQQVYQPAAYQLQPVQGAMQYTWM